MELLLRNYRPGDSVDEITDLLHRAYKRLADMNLRFVATCQTPETTLERIKSGYCLVALDGSTSLER